MKRSVKIFLFCFCCLAFIGCDRATKEVAKDHLKDKEALSYLHDTIRLQYVENTGAAMSLGDELPKTISIIVLSILPLALLLILSGYTIKNSRDIQPGKIFLLSMIVAGGIGNIIDRIFNDRHVPDFINIGINNLRTGIFNVADMCVTMGVIGLIVIYRNKFLPTAVKNRNGE
jgi:signal peptidase II